MAVSLVFPKEKTRDRDDDDDDDDDDDEQYPFRIVAGDAFKRAILFDQFSMRSCNHVVKIVTKMSFLLRV